MENGNRNRIHIGVIIFITAVLLLLWVAALRPVAADAAADNAGMSPYTGTYPDFWEYLESRGISRTGFSYWNICKCNNGYIFIGNRTAAPVAHATSSDAYKVGHGSGFANDAVVFCNDGSFSFFENVPMYLVLQDDNGFMYGTQILDDNGSVFFSGKDEQPSVYELYVRGLAYFKSIRGIDLSKYPYHYIYDYSAKGQISLLIFTSEQKVIDDYSHSDFPYSLSDSRTPRLRLFYDGRIVYLEDRCAFSADMPLWSNVDLYYGDTLMSKASDFVQPSVARLYARLPEELQAYTYKIILRQDHEDAHMNDIVFYGWNDVNADLIIRYGDSAVAAAKKGDVVADSRTARYDLSAGQWVVEELPGTYPGRTKNLTYCVPTVFYCNSDLFIQQSGQTGWYTVRQTVWRADTELPVTWDIEDPFGPGSEIEKPEFNTGIDWLDKLLDALGELLSPFFNGLGKLFSRLFVPSSDYFKNKVNSLQQKFCFWESVVSTVEVFLNFFENTDFSEPPKITVNLSSATSKYDYGTSATFLDLSWYEPYKPSVDMLLSSIMWVVFAWNTFKNLPSIIAGISTAANVGAKALREVKGGRDNDC